MFGVFDGHGSQGHTISQFLKKVIPECINKNLQDNKDRNGNYDFQNAINKGFILANQMLKQKKGYDSEYSGSTCIIVLIANNNLIVANVGDSRAILGKKVLIKQSNQQQIQQQQKINNQENLQNHQQLGDEINIQLEVDQQWKVKCISNDHKPNYYKERERILKYGGIIKRQIKESGINLGPERVWVQDQDYPGLAMTRSFGDFNGEEAGIICDPEIYEFQLQECDKIIVLGSDGIWDMLDNKTVIQMLIPFYQNNDIKEGTKYLAKTAQNNWIKSENKHIDDITCIVIFLDLEYPMQIDKIQIKPI